MPRAHRPRADMIARSLAGSTQTSPSSKHSHECVASTAMTPDAPTSPLVVRSQPLQLQHRPATPQIPGFNLGPPARVAHAPMFMDQDQALLLVAVDDASTLLTALSLVAPRNQTPQALLCVTNWRLNITLQDTELLLSMAALTDCMVSSRMLALAISDAQLHHKSLSTYGLTDFLTTDIMGKSKSQPSSPCLTSFTVQVADSAEEHTLLPDLRHPVQGTRLRPSSHTPRSQNSPVQMQAASPSNPPALEPPDVLQSTPAHAPPQVPCSSPLQLQYRALAHLRSQNSPVQMQAASLGSPSALEPPDVLQSTPAHAPPQAPWFSPLQLQYRALARGG
jgi:hypothetical protein